MYNSFCPNVDFLEKALNIYYSISYPFPLAGGGISRFHTHHVRPVGVERLCVGKAPKAWPHTQKRLPLEDPCFYPVRQ